MKMLGSDHTTFASCCSSEIKSFMQPVTLVIMIVSGMHARKTVVNTKSSTCAFIKGEDDLPNWVYETGTKFDDPAERSVQEMIKNWNMDPITHLLSTRL